MISAQTTQLSATWCTIHGKRLVCRLKKKKTLFINFQFFLFNLILFIIKKRQKNIYDILPFSIDLMLMWMRKMISDTFVVVNVNTAEHVHVSLHVRISPWLYVWSVTTSQKHEDNKNIKSLESGSYCEIYEDERQDKDSLSGRQQKTTARGENWLFKRFKGQFSLAKSDF